MKPSDDESFEGHRPWDKYGDGAAAGEYSFEGGGGGGGGGRRPLCRKCPILPDKRTGFSIKDSSA